MPKLTDEQRDDLKSLLQSLESNQAEAQTLTLSFADEDTNGDDFYRNVEGKIDEAIYGIECLLED